MRNLSKAYIYLFFGVSSFALVLFLILSDTYPHFLLLAKSFLSGKTYFTEMPSKPTDLLYFNGKYYWPNPPFPVIIMLPFTFLAGILQFPLSQGFVQLLLLITLGILLYRLFSTFCSKNDALFWTYGFIFSTAFLGVAAISWSWFFAHVTTVLLIFLAYLFYKKGYSLFYVGLIYGAVFLTRFTAVLGVFYYFFLILSENKFKLGKETIKKLIILVAPIFLAISVMFLYNYTRYSTWYEVGYFQNSMAPEHLKGRSYGVFNIKHVPGNLYYLFINTPEPKLADGISRVLTFPYVAADSWGMSIFITSPIFLLLFFYKYKKKEQLFLLVTSVIILVPILFYFGIGRFQFGYRYSLDFLPYLYILLVSTYYSYNKKLSGRLKLLILLTSISNFYLLFTFFLRP